MFSSEASSALPRWPTQTWDPGLAIVESPQVLESVLSYHIRWPSIPLEWRDSREKATHILSKVIRFANSRCTLSASSTVMKNRR